MGDVGGAEAGRAAQAKNISVNERLFRMLQLFMALQAHDATEGSWRVNVMATVLNPPEERITLPDVS